MNPDQMTWMVGGALLLGIVLGVTMYRGLLRWGAQFMPNREPCSVCTTVGFQFICERCKKGVAMCHSYRVLLPDSPEPAKMRPRPTRDLCTECVTDDERRLFDKRRMGQS